MTSRHGRTVQTESVRPDRAVIDIGSNTVRLVVYAGNPRAPESFLNEKVTARLGRDMAETGAIPDKAANSALDALRRFHALVTDLGVIDVTVVATAAVRQASNGAAFLERVRALGLDARIIDGEEEARASASGVIAAFPDARGVVADLGGGSLELVAIEDGKSHHGESLPIGTLTLAGLRRKGDASFKRAIHRAFDKAGWASEHCDTLYMVGGTWRAFAKYAMQLEGHPLSDPHGLRIPAAEAERFAKKLLRIDPETLRSVAGISNLRAAALPDAAELLRAMLVELDPKDLVFSSWGLREGLLYSRLPEIVRKQDPLLAGMAHFTAPRGGSISRAAMLAGWTSDITSGRDQNRERERLAASLLALAAWRLEPNIRTKHALDWALEKRWVGIDIAGRARLAAALVGACDKPALPAELLALADEESLREALGWGLALKVCRRLGAGSRASLAGSVLSIEDDELILWLDPTTTALDGDPLRASLIELANWLGSKGEVRHCERLPERAELTNM